MPHVTFTFRLLLWNPVFICYLHSKPHHSQWSPGFSRWLGLCFQPFHWDLSHVHLSACHLRNCQRQTSPDQQRHCLAIAFLWFDVGCCHLLFLSCQLNFISGSHFSNYCYCTWNHCYHVGSFNVQRNQRTSKFLYFGHCLINDNHWSHSHSLF